MRDHGQSLPTFFWVVGFTSDSSTITKGESRSIMVYVVSHRSLSFRGVSALLSTYLATVLRINMRRCQRRCG